MTKVEKYSKYDKRSRLFKSISSIFMTMLFITAIPFMYLAYTVLFSNGDSSTFSIVQLIFWFCFWMEKLFKNRHDKVKVKLDGIKLSEEDYIQYERQKKLDKLI